jgi:small subunit ribosomal protein S1
MSQDSQRYKVGQRVVGKVERLLPYGLFVCLADGTQAYIRRRELTWARNIDPRELWQEGEKIEGVVLKLAGPGQSMELTHRITLPDPWPEFVKKFHQGDVVEGTVKSLLGGGVFVEITPGVDGLILLPDLAPWQVQKPEDVVWVSDTVQAVITHLDGQTQKLRLSVRAPSPHAATRSCRRNYGAF